MTRHYTPFKILKNVVGSFALLIATCGSASAQLPPNLDFSLGNFNNWECYVGLAYTGTPTTGAAFTSPTLTVPLAKRHSIMSGAGVDAIGGFPVVAPGGGTYSVKLGFDSINNRAERVRYNIHVPTGTTKFNIQCQFAVVFENPSHAAEDQPTFQVVAYDSATGAVIPSANNLYISGYSIPGFIVSTAPSTFIGAYLPWTGTTVNLSGYGGKTVTVECTALACALGGHFGYGYFDVTGSSTYLAPTVASCDLKNNNIVLKGPAGYQYYQWFNQNFTAALNSPLDTNRVQTLPIPATAQYYNLVIYPFAAGGVPDTVRTNVISGFTASASPNIGCVSSGVATQLNTTVTGGAGNMTFTWAGATGLSASNIPNPTATLSAPGTYTVKVNDTNGCFRMDTVRLTVASYQVNAGADKTTCLGTAVSLNGSVSPATGSYIYSWMPSAGLSNALVSNPTYTPAAVGVQQLILQVDSGTCSRYDTVNIRTLTNTFVVSDTTVCEGVSVIPHVQGDTEFSYVWTPTSQLTFPAPVYAGSTQKPHFAADTTTTFTITASHAGCPNIVKTLTVTVEPTPVVAIGTTDTVYKSAAFPINLTANVAPSWFSGYSYSWGVSPLIDSPYNASMNFSGSSDTTLIVNVTTPNGCTGSDAVYISISNAAVMSMVMSAPNAFVPGSARNGLFRPVYIKPGYIFRAMRVYNRWGKKVFESHSMSDGWDGNFNGITQPTGAYVYMLEAVAPSGSTVMQDGNVTLIR